MQEGHTYNKPVVKDGLYPLIGRLFRHAQGQTLAEFSSPKPQGSMNDQLVVSVVVSGSSLIFNVRDIVTLRTGFVSILRKYKTPKWMSVCGKKRELLLLFN